KTAVPLDVAQSPGDASSLRCRKRIEESCGWGKTTAGLAQLKVRGLDKGEAAFAFALAAYNIIRLPKLIGSKGQVCLVVCK
ncbi:transposase, partial [Rhizobium ruizarguesonis]